MENTEQRLSYARSFYGNAGLRRRLPERTDKGTISDRRCFYAAGSNAGQGHGSVLLPGQGDCVGRGHSCFSAGEHARCSGCRSDPAYGKILPDSILEIPRFGAVNVHGSLLPKYRGSAPIQWAVLNGDRVTGVSTMYLSCEMDAGDVIYSEATEIGEYETSGELFDRLMDMGAKLLVRTLHDIESGTAPRHSQDHEQASYTKKLDKSMSPICWDQSPRSVLKWIYGLQPWPVATAEIGGVNCRVFSAAYSDIKTDKAPGCVVNAGKDGILVACADGETLMIKELQAPGKRRMAAADYLRGHPLQLP